MKYIIGIDIGGTKIAVSIATQRGVILAKRLLVTQKKRLARHSCHEIQETIATLIKEHGIKHHQLLGIGIAVPGPVHPLKQQIEKSPNLPGWGRIPLGRQLARRFGCVVFIENDANAAALGEKYFGAGKRYEDFIYVTVSTGIGSGIFANGELVRGASGSSGEIGHTTIAVGGTRCSCGKKGCLEAYASGTAIGRMARREIHNNGKSLILRIAGSPKNITGKTVGMAAERNDRFAIDIHHRAGDSLGVGLANLINIFNPTCLILGGGVLNRARYLWSSMMTAIKREAWHYPLRSCKIIRSRFKDKVGDFGAIAIVIDRTLQQRKSSTRP